MQNEFCSVLLLNTNQKFSIIYYEIFGNNKIQFIKIS